MVIRVARAMRLSPDTVWGMDINDYNAVLDDLMQTPPLDVIVDTLLRSLCGGKGG